MFELEAGDDNQKPDNEDIVVLLFGGIQTAFSSKPFAEDICTIVWGSTDRDLSLPSSLEDDKLVTISVAHNGSYIDDHGQQHSVPDAVFEAIGIMKLGQKVLIHEREKEEESDNEDEDEDEGAIEEEQSQDAQAEEEEAEGNVNGPETVGPNAAWGPNYRKEGHLEFGNGDVPSGPILDPSNKSKMVRREIRMRTRPASLHEVKNSACTDTDSSGVLNRPEVGTPELKARL
ncbi:hypothetical protein MMC18_000709 [Xylographa bjoerkii]|nr:hypothetical protein [Xylographa bjoerkii]